MSDSRYGKIPIRCTFEDGSSHVSYHVGLSSAVAEFPHALVTEVMHEVPGGFAPTMPVPPAAEKVLVPRMLPDNIEIYMGLSNGLDSQVMWDAFLKALGVPNGEGFY